MIGDPEFKVLREAGSIENDRQVPGSGQGVLDSVIAGLDQREFDIDQIRLGAALGCEKAAGGAHGIANAPQITRKGLAQ